MIGFSDTLLVNSYWDTAANNWAFDYSAYYAAHGRPSTSNAPEVDNATYVAQALQQASAYGQTEGTNGYYQYGPGSTAAAAGGASDRKPRSAPGPKDAKGNAVAGSLKKGETRETVLRKSVGKLYEDQTLLEWDPCE
jgi:hypothetical protein